MAGEIQLRSKHQLIEQFIEDNLPKIKPNEDVIGAFESYWSNHKQAAFKKLCEEENIVPEKFAKVLQTYEFQNRLPKDGEIVEALSFKPKILDRKSILECVADKIQNFINTFVEGMGEAFDFKLSSSLYSGIENSKEIILKNIINLYVMTPF